MLQVKGAMTNLTLVLKFEIRRGASWQFVTLWSPTSREKRAEMWGPSVLFGKESKQTGSSDQLGGLAHQAQVGAAAEVGEVGKDLAYLAVGKPHPAAQRSAVLLDCGRWNQPPCPHIRA